MAQQTVGIAHLAKTVLHQKTGVAAIRFDAQHKEIRLVQLQQFERVALNVGFGDFALQRDQHIGAKLKIHVQLDAAALGQRASAGDAGHTGDGVFQWARDFGDQSGNRRVFGFGGHTAELIGELKDEGFDIMSRAIDTKKKPRLKQNGP